MKKILPKIWKYSKKDGLTEGFGFEDDRNALPSRKKRANTALVTWAGFTADKVRRLPL